MDWSKQLLELGEMDHNLMGPTRVERRSDDDSLRLPVAHLFRIGKTKNKKTKNNSIKIVQLK